MEGEKQTIFSYITSEEISYQQNPIQVFEGYEWNMFKHIKLSLLYSVSKYSEGSADRPFKNIIRPILNLQHRAEGFDVKDIVLFVNSAKDYYKSFLIKKFHDKWARENELDTFIDNMVESYVNFGGALIKDVKKKIPEVVPLQRIAFCDQTDILSGPICEKHYYSPDQLKDMEKQGWENIDDLIALSEAYKRTAQTQTQSKTPTKYIEVYEIHGVMPERWLKDNADDTKYVRQMQIVSFYATDNKAKSGKTLFKGKESKSIYKFIARDKIFGRALGMGGAEELFEPQVWINYDAIRIRDLLDAASKIILQTTDPAVAKRQSIKSLENLQILGLAEGKRLEQVNTTPVNLALFERATVEWEQLARTTGAATESIMGEQPSSGTPFKLQELITAEAHSLHEYRKGKLATFLDEIYRDLIIPKIVVEINSGQEFLADCDLDELQEIVGDVVINTVNKINKEKVLNGENIGDKEMLKTEIKKSFMKQGKKLIQIIKDEIKDSPLAIELNIAGKQKYLSQITDKLTNIFRQIFANPQVLQIPGMAKLFNEIIEYSGFSPLNFTELTAPMQTMQQPQQTMQRPNNQPIPIAQ